MALRLTLFGFPMPPILAAFCVCLSLALAADPAFSDTLSPQQARGEKIDRLYRDLANAESDDAAQLILVEITQALADHPSATADLLMQRALQLARNDEALCGELLDKILLLEPQWAFAWEQRGQIYLTQNNDEAALKAFSRALSFEPRELAALSGSAGIMEANEFDKGALALYRRFSQLYPINESISKKVRSLTLKVEGTPL